MHLDALAADGRTFFCTWGTAGLHRTGGTARRSHTPAVPFGGSDRKRDAGGGAGRGQNGAAQCGERAGDLRPGGIPAHLRRRHRRRRGKHSGHPWRGTAERRQICHYARPHCRRDLSGCGGDHRRYSVPAWGEHPAHGEYAPGAGTDRLPGYFPNRIGCTCLHHAG